MTNLQGFWSYVHADDEADGGRIAHLVKDLQNQYEMLTGETLSVFFDKDALQWGENWRAKIDDNLASVAFFIPVLTPRYFMSPECRGELQFFARRATKIGIKDLVLPLYYVTVQAIEDRTDADDLIKLVCTFQWEDWRNLRFSDFSSEGYRMGVSRLATRLVEANRRSEETTLAVLPQSDDVLEGITDESPGFLDKLANAEENLLKWPETLERISRNVGLIGEIMQGSTDDIQSANLHGKGFAARLKIVRHTEQQLREPTEQIWSLSNEFESQLHGVDEGIRIIIEQAPVEIMDNPDTKGNFCDFFRKIRELTNIALDAQGSIRQMINATEPLGKMSRDLRPVLRRLRHGLTILVEAINVTNDWVHLIDSSGIDCELKSSQL